MVDESTDKGCTKHLCLVAKYLDSNNYVTDSFLGLLPIHQSGTASILYNLIKDFFKNYEIDYIKNEVGFRSDGTNTMMGCKNSLLTHIQSDIKKLFVLTCTCHSFALRMLVPNYPISRKYYFERFTNIFNTAAKKLGNIKNFKHFVR